MHSRNLATMTPSFYSLLVAFAVLGCGPPAPGDSCTEGDKISCQAGGMMVCRMCEYVNDPPCRDRVEALWASCEIPSEIPVTSASVSSSTGGATSPDGWTCYATYYHDGVCDCGCGVPDPDCASASSASCAHCDDHGSCNNASCPGTILANDNAHCQP
jgi:hypothetical protein